MIRRSANPALLRRPAFTLVETIATMVVVGVLALLSSNLILEASERYTEAVSLARLTSEMSATLERITTELRSVPVKPAVSPACADLLGLDTQSLSWNDGAATRELTLAGTDLVSATSGVQATLLRDVSGLSFRAMDQNGALLPAPLSEPACQDVRQIEISITCSRSGESQTLRTRVFLRAAASGGAP